MHKILTKRLLCLLLCMIMLLGVALTSCGEKTNEEQAEDIKEEASLEARTLAMYLMSEKQVSESTRQSIENAINRITKSKFTAQIELYIYTEEEYYDKLETAFARRDEAEALGLIGSASKEETESSAESSDESQSAVEIVYPEIEDFQVDIFYLGGEATYKKYVSDGRLKDLTSVLSESGDGKENRKFISPSFFTALEKLNGGSLYAVPTNKRIGEYTYLLLNKQALNEAQRRAEGGAAFDSAPYTSLTCEDTKDFLEFIKTYYSEEYAPLYTDFAEEELLINNLQYWGVDDSGELSDAFSVLGNYYDGSATIGQSGAYGTKIENLLENEQFCADLETLFSYKNDGYYQTEGDTRPFAVGYVKGSAEDAEKYSDEYEVVVLEKPTLEKEDVYSDMFGICSDSSDSVRAMKILTYLNTNEEFRNLILYGIEGTHYNLNSVSVEGEEDVSDDEEAVYKVVERLLVGTDEEYLMSVHKTGNELLAYSEANGAIAPDFNDYSVLQNRDSKVNLYAGFTYEKNGDDMRAIKVLSEEILSSFLSATDFSEFLNSAKAAVNGSESVAKMLDGENSTSLQKAFATWVENNRFNR